MREESNLHERLDRLWNEADMCECGTDSEWSQDISGLIRCTVCDSWVVDKHKLREFNKR